MSAATMKWWKRQVYTGTLLTWSGYLYFYVFILSDNNQLQDMATTAILQHEHDDKAQVKRIWKTFWLLSFITLAELGIGLTIYTIHKGAHPSHLLVLMFKGMISILTLAKAFYIVS